MGNILGGSNSFTAPSFPGQSGWADTFSNLGNTLSNMGGDSDNEKLLFYLTVLLVLGAVAFLVFYYYRQWRNYKEVRDSLTWPRSISNCPDFWVEERKGVCRNVHDLGKCPNNPQTSQILSNATVDFNGTAYKGPNGPVNKCKWTKLCNVSWEGVDNLCS